MYHVDNSRFIKPETFDRARATTSSNTSTRGRKEEEKKKKKETERKRDGRLVRREFGARCYRNTFVTYPGRFRPNICKITRPTAYPTVLSLFSSRPNSTSSPSREEKESSRNRMLLIELHDDEEAFSPFATVTCDPCYRFRVRK